MKLAEARGLEIVERHIKPEELADASEVFLTGTAVEVTLSPRSASISLHRVRR